MTIYLFINYNFVENGTNNSALGRIRYAASDDLIPGSNLSSNHLWFESSMRYSMFYVMAGLTKNFCMRSYVAACF